MTDTAAGVEGARAVGDGERRGPATLDQFGQQFVAHRARGGGDQRGDRQVHGAEQRSAGQRGAEFLDRDGLVDERAADAAVGLGHREPEHAELGAEPRPHLRVERRIGLHQPTHRLLVEVLGAELAGPRSAVAPARR